MARLFDDASSEYLAYKTPSGYLVPAPEHPISMSMWFYADDAPASGQVFTMAALSRHDDWPAIYVRLLNDSGTYKVKYGVYRGSEVTVLSAGVTLNAWHHVCVSQEPTDPWRHSLYVDGTETYTENSLEGDEANCISIGALLGGGSLYQCMSGSIAEVAWWDAQLTPGEAGALYDGVAPSLVRPAGLRCYYPLLRHDNDLVGGYHMTAYNTPSWTDHPRIIYKGAPHNAYGHYAAPSTAKPWLHYRRMAQVAGAR